MNKDKALERLTALESEAAQLRKIIEEPEQVGLRMPKKGEEYWFVNDAGSVYESTFVFHIVDEKRFSQGNVFRTKEQAEKASNLQARANKIIAAALQVDPDAGEKSEDRSWTITRQNGIWAESRYFKYSAMPAYVHTSEQAEQMAAILNAEGVK